MYFQYIMNFDSFNKVAPIKETLLELWEEGIPNPEMILKRKRKPFGFEYPENLGPRIHYWDLGLKEKDIFNGFLTNITFDKKYEKFDESNVVSLGHGLETKYLKKDDEGD